MRSRHEVLVVFVIASLFLTLACSQVRTAYSGESRAKASPTPSPCFNMTLSNGTPADISAERARHIAGQPLSETETAKIIARLPEFKAGHGQAQDFARRSESLAAPRTGVTIKQQFPAASDLKTPVPAEIAAASQSPFKVLRYSPEGTLELIPQVSVTFSRPVVAVTSQSDSQQKIPVKMEPQPEGKWRWLGTKTVVFDPSAGRLPMATKYAVTVPQTTTAADGAPLSQAVAFNFSTTPPKLTSKHPLRDSQPLNPPILLAFDQRIDAKTLLPSVELKAGHPVPFKIASAAEIDRDKSLSSMVKDLKAGTFVVITPEQPLPTDTKVTVTVKAGAPSAEGPLKTTEDQTFGFSTYGPLEIVDSGSGWGNDAPPPGTPWWIEFSNQLDDNLFDATKQISVSPALPDMRVSCQGKRLTIRGRSKGNTTYKVTIDKSITDIFGQTLKKTQTVTFKMGSTDAAMHTVGGALIVADPAGTPSYSVYTINYKQLDVELYRVTPSDWNAYRLWQQNRSDDDAPPIPGQRVQRQRLNIAYAPEEYVETRISLKPALTNNLGHAIVLVTPVGSDSRWGTKYAWVQATHIGLDAFADPDALTILATSLDNGKVLPGVKVRLGDGSAKTVSTEGTASFAKSDLSAEPIIASLGEDTAFLPNNTYSTSSWTVTPSQDQLRWYVFEDRGVYKPGETVNVKGWYRLQKAGKGGDIIPFATTAPEVKLTLRDARRNVIGDTTVQATTHGGFTASFKIPDDANLGRASLCATMLAAKSSNINGWENSHTIQIQEFRRPEFEVETSTSAGVATVGEELQITALAKYYAGGFLPDAATKWTVTATPTSFSPPNWDEFTFGVWKPWWNCRFFEEPKSQKTVKTFSGTTDSNGKHTLNIAFEGVEPAEPTSVVAAAAVSDVNRQTWSSSSTMLIHPASDYVGVRLLKTFVEKGQPINLDLIVTDQKGKPVADREVKLRTARVDWEFRNDRDQAVERDAQEKTVTSSTTPTNVKIPTGTGGRYVVSATIKDSKGRINRTTTYVWVAGSAISPRRNVEKQEVELVPDKREHRIGETAHVLVRAPFSPAEATITLRREGVVEVQRVTMTEPTYELNVPIKEAYLPSIELNVSIVGASPRANKSGDLDSKLPTQPAYASGSLTLSIPPYERTLKVQVTPREHSLNPGGSTTLDVSVSDAQGKPVNNAEITVIAIDEAVLSLTGHKFADPVASFYLARSSSVRDYHSREFVQLDAPPENETQDARGSVYALDDGALGSAPEAFTEHGAARTNFMSMKARSAAPRSAPKAAASGETTTPIALRTNFNALALFAAAARSDSHGKVSLDLKLPDNLTRYRLVAIAADSHNKFGKGEASLTARLPLMVRPAAPRFLNFGDRVMLPIVVQNQTDETMDVELALRTRNLALANSAGRKFSVPANDRVEVSFAASTVEAGSAAFQAGAVSGTLADAAEINLPVWTPCTTEAFATYGQIDQGAIAQPVSMPGKVWTQFGGLDVTTSSTALQELTDAVIYLVNYPFECSEQISSRMIAIASLKDVLAAFKSPDLPSKADLALRMQKDIRQLRNLQRNDGAVPLWKNDGKDLPFVSVHVAHALYAVKSKGYDVPEQMLERSTKYLHNVDSHIPSDYSPETRRAIRAYALDVLCQMGEPDGAEALKVLNETGVEKATLSTLGWLLPTLNKESKNAAVVAEIRRHLNNRVTETAATANFVESYADNDYVLMHSSRRTDGILLNALIQTDPKNDLIPKITRGLLAHRTAGHWSSTQENVFILAALDRYFRTYEKVSPDFVAQIWLGDVYAGEHTFKGRSADYQETNVPMKWLSEQEKQPNLIINKNGDGRLYYRIGMKYAPKDLKQLAADYGFTVQREYTGLDNPDDVVQQPDGSWKVKLGSRVSCKVTMVAPNRRYHVALVDPMPAGFEAINTAFKNTETLPDSTSKKNERNSGRYFWWFWSPWYEHTNLRDERAEAFSTLLWDGVYDYTYTVRATTPGTFVVPPAKAEEMYHPEVFGRSDSTTVVIE